MTLKELLQILANIAKENKINTPYIVGGVPRNILLGKSEKIKDIDITTGNADSKKLAKLFAAKLNIPIIEKGRNTELMYGEIKFDFSTNFIYGDMDNILLKKDIKNPSNLIKETFSRDFTTNTLLLDLNLAKILDLTGTGKADSISKILRCPVDCNIAFSYSPKRMLRAFVMKATYGYTFTDEVLAGIKRNKSLLELVSPKSASKLLNKILINDPEVINELVELGLMQFLPLTKDIIKTLLEQRKILDVL